MKKTLVLVIITSLIFLVSCSKEETTETTKAIEKVEKVEKEVKKLEAKTITIKEVSRIALVEAKQFLSEAGEKAPKADLSKANELYAQAESLFDKGEYKEAQKLSVDVRHIIEKILIAARKMEK